MLASTGRHCLTDAGSAGRRLATLTHMRTVTRALLRPMTEADIPEIMDIERESFPSMWPQTAYKRELQNKAARYLVLAEPRDAPGTLAAPHTTLWTTVRRVVGVRETPPAEYILGFIGVWLMVGEAHIVTVAVREDRRRTGIGERLLIASIEMAMDYDQQLMTLEVRRSNDAAQLLYEKYGFDRVGMRVRYYSDNHEDAVIMTTPPIASNGFRARFEALRQHHRQRYPELWE
jgi:[ribosomal protein S18]-alanine N-acetyltransferase